MQKKWFLNTQKKFKKNHTKNTKNAKNAHKSAKKHTKNAKINISVLTDILPGGEEVISYWCIVFTILVIPDIIAIFCNWSQGLNTMPIWRTATRGIGGARLWSRSRRARECVPLVRMGGCGGPSQLPARRSLPVWSGLLWLPCCVLQCLV